MAPCVNMDWLLFWLNRDGLCKIFDGELHGNNILCPSATILAPKSVLLIVCHNKSYNLPPILTQLQCSLRPWLDASEIRQSSNLYTLQNVNFQRCISSLPLWESAIGNKPQLLLIADGLLCVFRKAESTNCRCEYLQKVGTRIKSKCIIICQSFDSLIEGGVKTFSCWDFKINML